jgi:hypothetical protein
MKQRLTLTQILAWADAHYQRTKRWPSVESGPIHGAAGETWKAIHQALVSGCRGLPGAGTLARLLAAERGVRNHCGLPPHSIDEILAWAEAHYQRNGHWPHHQSGSVEEAPGETWSGINASLGKGNRGLPGGASLAYLIRVYRAALLRQYSEIGLWDGGTRVASAAVVAARWIARRGRANKKESMVAPRELDRLEDLRGETGGRSGFGQIAPRGA